MQIKIKKATWQQVIEEERNRRLEFGKALMDDYDNKGLSFRDIAEQRNMSHETARKLIMAARCQDVSRVA